jgi:uncharacterized protein (TIGR00297 family)
MPTQTLVFLIILPTAVFASYKTGKLTLAGSLTGGLVAAGIYLGAGLTGITMLAAFFVLSVLATSHGKKDKFKLGIEDAPTGKRNAGQVLANGGMAGILGLLIFVVPDFAMLFTVMIAASLASATADTLSSELGTVYGRRFYNIITLKPDEKGRDGVISLEGTLIGLAGSGIIALIYSIGFGWDINCLFIIIAGTTGNLSDSILGATLERKGLLNNDAVNFANTTISAITACLLMMLQILY